MQKYAKKMRKDGVSRCRCQFIDVFMDNLELGTIVRFVILSVSRPFSNQLS